jgi:hypothetical protein
MTPSVSSPPATEAGPGLELSAECRAFTRYLTGRDSDAYVLARYQAGHHSIPYRGAGARSPIDGALVLFASKGPVRARVADAYARVFRPHGALRQKLTLLLAILENAPATHRRFTSGGKGLAAAVFGIAGALIGFGFFLALGVLLLGPAHLLLSRAAPR